MKELYNKMFFFLADKKGIDYVVNLEYEYGIEEVIAEAYKEGFQQ